MARYVKTLKEESMRARYVKTLEQLNEHSKKSPPLVSGDHVFVQNQHGPFPTKWDKSGIVVEVKNHDQYLVKVTGTGRITLRNRRFLRKYKNHPHLQVSHSPKVIQNTNCIDPSDCQLAQSLPLPTTPRTTALAALPPLPPPLLH